MAGIDVLNAFPNSRMAKAARLGQSRFVSGEDVVVSNPSAARGVFTINTAGTYTTAQLLTLAGLTQSFSTFNIDVANSTAGVGFAQGSGNILLDQGTQLNLPGPISATQNPITLTLAAGDDVKIQYSGT